MSHGLAPVLGADPRPGVGYPSPPSGLGCDRRISRQRNGVDHLMAVADVRVEPRQRYPGLDPAMMGMYIFLASEVMFFGSMFAMYFYLFGSHPFNWPPPNTVPVNWWPIPFFNTIILLSSGVTCHF